MTNRTTMAATQAMNSKVRTLWALASLCLLATLAPVNAASLAQKFAPKGTGSLDHSALSSLLAKYVVAGQDGINRVNYRGLRQVRGQLTAYLTQMQKVSVPSLSSNAAKAYWMNLYNAKTLEVILDHYPIKSIRDIGLGGGLFSKGPWKKKILNVGGTALSLDDVEHEIARKLWKDPRLHYGFNCASIGCPNLGRSAFTGAQVNQQLDQAARDFINHPRAVSVSGNSLTASKIYQWYKSDFGTTDQLRSHWLTYANGPLGAKIKQTRSVKSYRYDWSLNEAR